MAQQVIAAIIILFFLSRSIRQKMKKEITRNEFIFWQIFWLLSLLAVAFIKQIDALVALIGFSGQGIDVLLYLGVLLLFYLVLRLRLKIEKIEKNITKIIRDIALKKDD